MKTKRNLKISKQIPIKPKK